MSQSPHLASVYPSERQKNGPQLPKDAAVEHAGMLHPNEARGRVSIAVATPHGWRERSYRVDQLPDVLPALAGETDAYISQQRFECKRVITQLWQLGALFSDLDFHEVPELADMHPLGVLEDVLTALERARKPAPTLAIFSGRGMYPIWLHNPLPRTALPRWNACQRELYEVLRPFGADPRAMDAARVLRIVGTINSKSGAVVEQIAPPGEVWNFDDLADEILPLERGELHDLRIKRAARAARSPSKRLDVPSQGFNTGTLWAGRLGDLQRLRGIRWSGDLPPGERDNWLFLAGVAMSWIAIPPVLERELRELAKEAANWSDEESARRLQAIMKRAHMAARGEQVEWPLGSGRMVDARYRLRNQTIIEWLEITSDEEEDMDVIISKTEKRRRDRERKAQERREAGIADRYEIAAQNKAAVLRMTQEGKGASQISDRLTLSERYVKQLRSELKQEGLLSYENGLSKPSSLGGELNFPLYGGVAYPEGVSGSAETPAEFPERTESGEGLGAQPQTAQLRDPTPPRAGRAAVVEVPA
jgi:hypothetical protein